MWLSWKIGNRTTNFDLIKLLECYMESLPETIFTAYVIWGYSPGEMKIGLLISLFTSMLSLGYALSPLPFMQREKFSNMGA